MAFGLARRRLLAGLGPAGLRQVEVFLSEEGYQAVAYLAVSVEGRRWYIEDAADRDPTLRSENVPDVASLSYSVPGGDVMGANVLLPAVRDMLAPWRNPAP